MKKCVWSLLGFFVLAFSSIYLVACSHSDGGSAWFGAGGTGKVNTFSIGPITDIGTNSITVNGVDFSTSNANITVNGHPGVASDLKVGQVVTVKGKASGTKGTASQIVFSSDLLGPVSSVTASVPGLASSGTLTVTVFGQNVLIDRSALSSGGTGTSDDLASLATNSIIDVSGLPDSAGTLHATFVSRPTASVQEFSVRGLVTSSTGSTFTLKPFRTGTPLTVNVVSGPTVSISTGKMVDVKIDPGTFDPGTFTPATPITAKSVTVEEELKPAENNSVSMEGFVSAPTGSAGANTFDMNGMSVDAGSFAMPPVDTRVVVHGKFSNGVLKADRIELAGMSNFFIGALGSISTGTMSFGTGTNTNLFNMSSAKILVNGKAGTQNDLEAGKQVIIKSAATVSTMSTGTTGTMGFTTGTVSGRAPLIWIVDNLTGPVSNATVSFSTGQTGTVSSGATGTVTVFGQNIIIDRDTKFGKNIASAKTGTGSVISFSTGSAVNVSGVPDGAGNIVASFIDSRPTATQYHVLGMVSSVTGSPATVFTLTPSQLATGGTATAAPLTVTLATGVTQTTALADGQLVDVTIDPAKVTDPASTSITAESVDVVNQPKPADGDQVTVEGVVYNASGNTFTVNGINVDASGVSGGMPFGLANGSKVRVRGVMSGTTLMAEAIEITS